jgi:hypothetical protein
MVPLVALAVGSAGAAPSAAASAAPNARPSIAAEIGSARFAGGARVAKAGVRGRAVGARYVLRAGYVPRPYRKG